MFKKTKIAAVSAAILGLSSMTASAVSLNEAGSQGQVLIFPYYNVNASFLTVFNITNTTNQYKAVKIRFRESGNSNDVLDFNLYMSPFDVFTLNLGKGDDEGVVLKTADSSCTFPAIPEDGVAFRHDAYASTTVDDVREGYLEVIEMGIISELAYITNAGSRQYITTGGILHVNGEPIDCGVINKAWQQAVFTQGGAYSNGMASSGDIDTVHPKATGYQLQPNFSDSGYYGEDVPNSIASQTFRNEAERGRYSNIYPDTILAPTGGLVGTSILIDTANVTGFVAEPISVENYSTRAQHYLSSDEHFYLLPSLASGSVATAENDRFQVAYSTVARDWGLDDLNVAPRVPVPSGINPMPLADSLLVTNLGNQYFLGEGTETDWVLFAPMRKHAIYNDYQYHSDNVGYSKGVDIPVGSKGRKGGSSAPNGYWEFLSNHDVNAFFNYWDREETPNAGLKPGDFSPPRITVIDEISFEREVNIFSLNTGSGADSVLGSANATALTLQDGFNNGWGAFTFNSYNLASTRYSAWVDTNDAVSAFGVPLSGFMAVRSALGEQNVGETFPHFYNRAR